MNNNFTKSDLKDGMVVTFRNGEEHYIVENGTEIQKLNPLDLNWYIPFVYTEDLIHNANICDKSYSTPNYDIVKVSYMGKTLWKRKELYTLEELYEKWEKGEVIGNTLIQSLDFITDLHNVWGKIDKVYRYDRKIKYVTERMWEIVEE